MTLNLPIFISLLRVFVIPVLVLIFYSSASWASMACAGIFVFAAISDWLDGYVARRVGQVTKFGAFIDPIADKLIVSVAVILIAERAGVWFVTLPILIIITREIAVSGLREWMASLGLVESVAVSRLGKVKTVFQMVAITLLLWEQPIFELPTFEIGLVLLYIAAVLTIWSMLIYIVAAKRSVRS